MKTKKIIFAAYALLIILIPLYLIMHSENILSHGIRHKIRLQGYDPVDPFRGKYLQLSFNDQVECGKDVTEGNMAFVQLKKDAMGFSEFVNVTKTRPSNPDYLEAEISYVMGNSAKVKLDNISKFFINEDKVQDAEQIITDFLNYAPTKIYLAIRVLDGESRVEGIYVNSKPLLKYIESGDHQRFKMDNPESNKAAEPNMEELERLIEELGR